MRQAIRRATRNTPTDAICLPQALAAQRMLARRGLIADLFIGTRLGDAHGEARDTSDRIYAFHSWLKYDRFFVTGDCDESRYRILGFTGN